MTTTHTFFANCARGCEDVLMDELNAVGASSIQRQKGGALFSGPREVGWRACLHLRSASRVLRELHRFPARTEQELYRGVRAVDWSEHLTADMTLAVRATSRKSRLSHTQFLAQKTKDAVVDRLREQFGRRPSVDTRSPDVPISLHIARNKGAVFLDLCGEPLFKRGYRKDTGEAPMKETLAASILLMANYTGERPLADPMCGAGTLPIEAALIASGQAPGLTRPFAFERFASFGADDQRAWEAMKREARGQIRPAPEGPAPIVGYDTAPAVIRAARTNAEEAGVSPWVRFEVADALTVELQGPPGLIVINPPYGHRLGEEAALTEMVEALGTHLKAAAAGWRVAVISGQADFRKAFPLRPDKSQELFNGPLRCRLYEYEIFP